MNLHLDDRDLLQLAADGDSVAMNTLFDRHRTRLKRCVKLRQVAGTRRRFDSSDVLQEAYIEVARRLGRQGEPKIDSVPVFVFLRGLVLEKLIELSRRHVRAQRRAVGRELPIQPTDAHSAVLARQVIDCCTTPMHRAEKEEMFRSLAKALDELNDVDCQLLLLRHFEQMTNREAAAVMQMNPATASSRYYRALVTLRQKLEAVGVFWNT